MSVVNPARESFYKRVFKRIDKDKDDLITPLEVSVCLMSLCSIRFLHMSLRGLIWIVDAWNRSDYWQ